MTEFRNVSNDTVVDYMTGKVVDPDQVIDIPDSIVEFYENHPVFKEVGGYNPVPLAWRLATTEPVAQTPVVDNDADNQE